MLTEGTYRFGSDGKAIMTTEIVNENGTQYYYLNGKRENHYGIVEFDGYLFYVYHRAKIVVDGTVWVSKTNGYVAEGTYRFDEKGHMIRTTEIVRDEDTGVLYYYKDGKRTANAGVLDYNGAYFYVASGGIAAAGQSVWVEFTNGLVEKGTYRFDVNGHMIMTTEVVNEGGTLYYYCNGKRTANAGLIELDGEYYYIDGKAVAAASTTIRVDKTNGLVPAGEYEFDAFGHMIVPENLFANGIVDGYYYVNGVKTEAGLLFIDDCYYYADKGGKLITGQRFTITKTNDLLEGGIYRFDADGKIILTSEIVEEDGALYFYNNGKRAVDSGLIQFSGAYYFVCNNGKLRQNETVWISKTNDLLPEGTYRFDANGKIIMTNELVDENGTLYYYKNGKRAGGEGLIEYNGAYYYINSSAVAVTNVTRWIDKTNDLMPVGTYTFGADGKMVL